MTPVLALPHMLFDETWGSSAPRREIKRAKAISLKIKHVSSAGAGYYYVTKKNSRTQTEKLSMKKYDPVARKHVEFKESKIK